MLWVYRLGRRVAYALVAKADAVMNHERIIWWIVLGPLCALLILTVAIGAGPVNAAFEALFQGISWVVAVWLVLLGVA
jgi:hypothetical protein